MIKQISLISILLSLTNLSQAQSECPCCTDFHSQFDFWVGDWIVYDTAGNKVGENNIVKLEDNCIVSEHWQGTQGGTGRSYNYFDTSDSTWNQLWIDSQGSNLSLKGKGDGSKMVLQSKLTRGKKVDWYYNRITWTKNNEGTVVQLWEILDESEKLLTVAFMGIYKKKL